MVRWLNKLFVKTSNLIIIIIIYDEQISFSTHLIKTNNCVDYSYRGDEWSLRAFASMPSTAIFLRARAEIKNLLYERASTRLNFASKSSKVKILRAVKNFNGTFITPSYKEKKTVCFFICSWLSATPKLADSSEWRGCSNPVQFSFSESSYAERGKDNSDS